MLKSFAPRTVSRSIRPITSSRLAFRPSPFPAIQNYTSRRGYASEAEEKDVVVIGGGVAGYVAAIKAGQEGLKVSSSCLSNLASESRH
jgi:dihydrolipoamide dehydrogenase